MAFGSRRRQIADTSVGKRDSMKPASAFDSVSQAGVDLIKAFEGFHTTLESGSKAQAYICPAGKLTVGWGHTGEDVKPGLILSREDCEELLRKDLRDAMAAVRSAVTVDITQYQFDALVSFVFNLGAGRFRSSTLLRQINAQAGIGPIVGGFMMWTKFRDPATGELVDAKGLVERRRAEADLYSASESATVRIGSDRRVTAIAVNPPAAKPAAVPAAAKPVPQDEAKQPMPAVEKPVADLAPAEPVAAARAEADTAVPAATGTVAERPAASDDTPQAASPVPPASPPDMRPLSPQDEPVAPAALMPQEPLGGELKPLYKSRTLHGVGLASLGLAGSWLGRQVEAVHQAMQSAAAAIQKTLWGFDPAWIGTALVVFGLIIVVRARIDDRRQALR